MSARPAAAAQIVLLGTTLLMRPAAFGAQPTAGSATLEEVTVSATPLGGLELPIDRVPGNIQRATSDDIERAHQATLADFLNQRLGSVFVNETQSNPLQPDVQFRGFVASPLLGQPQGIAVYQDGVRINDPFGDIVNWALVPEGAISSVELVSGSNPVFGLNALGGALSLRMKDGFSAPGTQAEVTGGSFGRAIATLESGGSIAHRWSYYGSARYLTEDGWRDHSPSDALHLFADAGWRSDTSSLAANLTRIETDLIGNGPAPVQLLALDRNAVYTYPDRTQNSLLLASLSGSHRIGTDVQMQGVAYYRSSDIDSLNGDAADYGPCEAQPELVCTPQGEMASDPHGDPIPFSAAVDGAALNRSTTRQRTRGASAQIGTTTPLLGHDNRLIVGAALDRSSVQFDSGSELGYFDASRGAVGSGDLVDAATIDLAADIDNAGVYLTETFAVRRDLDLTLSARYNETHIELRDRRGEALNGDHRYEHLNGAAGLTWRPMPNLRLYASYSESNRAPSPVELTCADETAPCALPNAFLADPPLEQVLATTLEAGARGTWRDLRWHAGIFRTDNANDILFVSAGALTNQGFFENVGDTRRQGIELNFDGKAFDRLSWYVNYTYLQARFMESFEVMSPHNPAAVQGEIAVHEGDSIPGVPEHLLAAGASFALTPALSFSCDVKHQSHQYLRGDEGNLTAPLAGYTTVNLGAQWQASPAMTLFVQVDNLFDERYGTFGLYGNAQDVLGEHFDDPRFISPAAPLGAWVGLRWTW